MNEEQKVRLCYTVKLNEVPDEISKFLQKTLDLNEKISTDLDKAKQKSRSGNTQFALDSIREARLQLVKLDMILEDVVELLSGYQQAMENLRQEQVNSISEAVGGLGTQEDQNVENEEKA